MNTDTIYIKRCIELAKLGIGKTSPNPIVGAVLVYQNNIISEGYYEYFGGPHAEVNCINKVAAVNQHLIPLSTLYVSLEPCCIFGKTPPCTQLIIQHQIKHVVIGCMDANTLINGKGIAQLQAVGVTVEVGVLKEECMALNEPFFYNQHTQLPYTILKWAQTNDEYIATTGNRVFISNDYTNRWVHQLRNECDGIMVGTHTVLKDNPQLNVRLEGHQKITRIIIDKQLVIPNSFHIYNKQEPTIILNCKKQGLENDIEFIKLHDDDSFLIKALHQLYQKNIGKLLVEGGGKLLQSFIDKGFWNKCYTITNQSLFLRSGVKAPTLHQHQKMGEWSMLSDKIDIYQKQLAS
jgi:diaminohydroxyphosphoribosylaminopyrimidine deaminase / 5-amino-6-(5-phosphoribosylamino)uracil reductase